MVYKHGEKLIYMYQACWNTVQEGKNLMVPDEVKESLRKTGWYTETLRERPDHGPLGARRNAVRGRCRGRSRRAHCLCDRGRSRRRPVTLICCALTPTN